jgi:hypothetical protein
MHHISIEENIKIENQSTLSISIDLKKIRRESL